MDEKEILKKAEKVFKYRDLSLLSLVVGMIAMFFFYINIIFLIIGIILFVSFFIISALYWKCPNCNRRFEMRHTYAEKIMTHCPYCGVKLRNKTYYN